MRVLVNLTGLYVVWIYCGWAGVYAGWIESVILDGWIRLSKDTIADTSSCQFSTFTMATINAVQTFGKKKVSSIFMNPALKS